MISVIGALYLGSGVCLYFGGGERETGSEGIDVGVGRRAAAGVGVVVGGGCWCWVSWWPVVVEDADCEGTSG